MADKIVLRSVESLIPTRATRGSGPRRRQDHVIGNADGSDHPPWRHDPNGRQTDRRAADPPPRSPRLGYVSQEREIFSSLTVIENLAVAALPEDWPLDRVFALFP